MKRKAISIMQPWAWLIIHAGNDIENRTWRRAFTGDVMVHAGLKMDKEADQLLLSGFHPVTHEPAPALSERYRVAKGAGHVHQGGIVGEVEITGCRTSSLSDWFVGPYGFTLTNPRERPFLPCKGALSFFVVEMCPVEKAPSVKRPS